VKICFLLPANVLSGGHVVIYEMANRLAEKGHDVSIYYPVLPPRSHWAVKSLAELKGLLRGVQRQLFAGRPAWFDLKVPLVKVPWVSSRWLPDADVLVAPHWDVQWAVRRFPGRKGIKIHYVHNTYRILGKFSELAREAWSLPGFRVVVNKRLQEEMRSMGLESEYVPNGIDLNRFYIEVPLEDRDPYTVAMLYSNSATKGCADGLRALDMARKALGRIRAILFGPARLRGVLEPWICWGGMVPHPRLVRVYNEASIFLCASSYEGWGLPGMEAMACGCALVSTRHDGVLEYAEHGVSALLAPVGDVDGLAEHICRLVSNTELRLRIARKGLEAVQRFPWERSVEMFEQALLKALKGGEGC
jgi:glycosyltransferase involved in cell wall biosynthesis